MQIVCAVQVFILMGKITVTNMKVNYRWKRFCVKGIGFDAKMLRHEQKKLRFKHTDTTK